MYLLALKNNMICIINHWAFFVKTQIKFHKQLMTINFTCMSLHHLKDCLANFTKLQPSIQRFDKMRLQSQLIILAPVSEVCKPIFLLCCYYRIRLIITGDDSPAAPG